jgi:hypothetical protein
MVLGPLILFVSLQSIAQAESSTYVLVLVLGDVLIGPHLQDIIPLIGTSGHTNDLVGSKSFGKNHAKVAL